MATTKIWPIRDNLKRVVDYAANPEKTESKDLMQVLHYAASKDKTTERECACFVTGINCHAEHAFEEMHAVKVHFGKTGGNVAYHCYQSFLPSEVTPEQCHEIGVQLARQLWGDKYQVLVATHLDKNHLHNHLALNSVSFVDGKKFNCDKKAYYAMREASDALCQAHSLSVIKNPKGKTPRSIYFAEKNGEPTRHNLMRDAIDKAAAMSFTMTQFTAALKKQGYVLEINPNRKYPTIRSINSKKAVRLYRLGDEYLPDQIRQRILSNSATQRQQYYRFMSPPPKADPKQMQYRGSGKPTRKITGLRALYLYYCYRLGVIPKRNPQKPLSPEMREACRRMNEISRQVRLKEGFTMSREGQTFSLPRKSSLVEDLFTTQAMRDDAKLERIQIIPLAELYPFQNHPFKVKQDAELEKLTESIRAVGSITPALARPRSDGGYELISGHRRLAACKILGLETMPVVVKEMSDDEAVIAMVDANMQRETILPSEKAFAYKMKLDALKHQGVASRQVGEKLLSVTLK